MVQRLPLIQPSLSAAPEPQALVKALGQEDENQGFMVILVQDHLSCPFPSLYFVYLH